MSENLIGDENTVGITFPIKQLYLNLQNIVNRAVILSEINRINQKRNLKQNIMYSKQCIVKMYGVCAAIDTDFDCTIIFLECTYTEYIYYHVSILVCMHLITVTPMFVLECV